MFGIFVSSIGDKSFANEVKNFPLGGNHLRLKVFKNSSITTFWGEFGFVDVGNDRVKIRPIYNGKPVHHSEFPSNLYLNDRFEVKLIDNNGYVYARKIFEDRTNVKDLAVFLEGHTLRYGLDSVQVIPLSNYISFGVTGYIFANLNEVDYYPGISNTQAYNTSFRVEKDGLYAQYIHQKRIPNGEYIIEMSNDLNKVMTNRGNGLVISSQFDSTANQKLYFEYDEKLKAYKIKSQLDGLALSWTSRANSNVIFYTNGNYKDQYWYLQKASVTGYRLVNARDTSKVLRLNPNNTHFSVADFTENTNNEFRIVKSSDKLNFLDGYFKLSPKIDTNKVVDVNTNDKNITIFDNNNGDNQMFRFVYVLYMDAYVIVSKLDPNQVLAWNDYNGSKNVFLTRFFSTNQEHFWKLEQLPNGYFIIKNAKNENLVLDVERGDSKNGTNIQVFERKYNDNENQMFKIVKP